MRVRRWLSSAMFMHMLGLNFVRDGELFSFFSVFLASLMIVYFQAFFSSKPSLLDLQFKDDHIDHHLLFRFHTDPRRSSTSTWSSVPPYSLFIRFVNLSPLTSLHAICMYQLVISHVSLLGIFKPVSTSYLFIYFTYTFHIYFLVSAFCYNCYRITILIQLYTLTSNTYILCIDTGSFTFLHLTWYEYIYAF